MRIVITGASGFLGQHVVSHALSLQHTLTSLARSPHPKLHTHPWDALHPTHPPTEALLHQDAVIHLAGAPLVQQRWTPTVKKNLWDSRVLGTRSLVQALAACPEHARPKVWIQASAIGYYGDTGQTPVDESSPKGTGFLADLVQAWEHEALQAKALGVRTVLLRLGVVLSLQGGALKRMPPVRIGNGRQWLSFVHIHDAVQMLFWALQTPHIQGPLNVVAPQPLQQKDFAHQWARFKHLPFAPAVPSGVLRVALGEMADMLIQSQRVLPQQAQAHGFVWHKTLFDP
jgi:uncharacterized protein (TIGR01777 family)